MAIKRFSTDGASDEATTTSGDNTSTTSNTSAADAPPTAEHTPLDDVRRELHSFRRESLLLGAIGEHPHIIELLGVCLSPPCLVLSLETGGDLFSFLCDGVRTLSCRSAVRLGRETASAIAFLHSLVPPVVHRDLSMLEGGGGVL